MDAIIENFFNIEILRLSAGSLLRGLTLTAVLAVVFIPLGALAGLVLAATCAISGGILRGIMFVWIDFFRSFPPLVLLIYTFYGAPILGYQIGPYAAIAVALTLNTSSYFAEILRAGIESVSHGQWHAARSTGMSWLQAFLVVILPQGVRTVLPDLVSNVVTNVQLTSLASVVGVHELLHAAMLSQGATYNVSPLIAAALLYLALLWPFVRLVSYLEGRLRRTSSPPSTRGTGSGLRHHSGGGGNRLQGRV
jgi:polar amino acid transport system permease protein